jgi:hypothetical protein
MLEDLAFLEKLPKILVTEIILLLPTGIVPGTLPLMRLNFSKFSKRFKYETYFS